MRESLRKSQRFGSEIASVPHQLMKEGGRKKRKMIFPGRPRYKYQNGRKAVFTIHDPECQQ